MNDKGFTLIELLIVIALIGTISLMLVPSMAIYYEKGNEELYNSYEKMMAEYAKVSEIKKDRIELNELEGLDNIKKECKGYVITKDNNYQAFISCSNYQTIGYKDA